MTPLALAAISWGALAFGAVYPWAYWPLFAAAAVAGCLGWLGGRRLEVPPHRARALIVALGAIALSVSLQLAPLPVRLVGTLSPATDALLRTYDLGYAARAASASGVHALSIGPSATVLALAALVSFGLFLVGIDRGLSRTGASSVTNGVVALGFLLALIAIVQRATDTDRIYGFWRPIDRPYQIFGPFVNRNHFAGWMMMALSLGIGALGARASTAMRGVQPDWRSRVLWFSTAEANELVLLAFAVVVMGLALLLTRSRSAFMCFGATLMFASWFAISKGPQRRGRRVLAIGYLALLAVIAVTWAGIDPIIGRFAGASGLSGRADAWRAAMRIAGDFPLFGTGLNTFGIAIVLYGPSLEAHWGATHNDYLQLVSEGGLLVCVPVVAALAVLVREIRRRLSDVREDPETRWVRFGAVVGLVAIGIQESVDFSLQIPGIAVLFSLLCAIAIHVPAPSQVHRVRGH